MNYLSKYALSDYNNIDDNNNNIDNKSCFARSLCADTTSVINVYLFNLFIQLHKLLKKRPKNVLPANDIYMYKICLALMTQNFCQLIFI